MATTVTEGRIIYTERTDNNTRSVVVKVGSEPRQFLVFDESLFRDATVYLGKDVAVTYDDLEPAPQEILGLRGKGNDT